MAERSYLVIQSGPRSGERVSIEGDRFSIGRRPGNSLVLTDASVSGNHCELRRQGDRWQLRDLGSTNGTFYGGAKVLEANVAMGDQFAIGSVLLRLEGDADEILLEEEAPQSGAEVKTGTVKPSPVKPAPVKAAPVARSGELDFVEDEPIPGPGRTQTVNAAVVSARSVRGADAVAADPTVVSDAGLVQRARNAAEAAAKRHRTTTAVVGVAAILAVATGAYFAFFSSSSPTSRHKPPAQVAGNLLAAGLAAVELPPEDAAPRVPEWQLRDTAVDGVDEAEEDAADESSARRAKGVNSAGVKGANASGAAGDAAVTAFYGFGYTTKRPRTGQRALEARLDGRGFARASTDPVSIQAGQAYTFAVHASAGANAGALVQLIFRSKSNPTLRIVRSGGAIRIGEGGSEYARLEGTAAVPSGCDLASLSVVAFGANETVLFDDAEIVPSAQSAPVKVVRKDLDFEADGADGRIRKIDRDLVQRMGVLVEESGGRPRRSLLAASAAPGEWSFLSPEGDDAKVHLTAEPADTHVALKYKASPGAAAQAAKRRILLTWSVDRTFAPEILARGPNATSRHRGDFNLASCSALVVGQDRERLRVSFAPPVGLRGTVDGGLTRLEWEAPPDLTITVQFSFEAEKRRAFELEQQADAADAEGRSGDAIALRSQIIEEFPFEAALVERNQAKRDARILEGQKVVGRLERAIADADLFRIPEAFRLAKRQAELLTSQYRGTDVAERAKAVIDAVDRALADVEAERGEREALRLKTIADAFAAANSAALSGYIRGYVQKTFPSTKAAASMGGR